MRPLLRRLAVWWGDSTTALRAEWRRLAPLAIPWLLGVLVGLPLLWLVADDAIDRSVVQARGKVLDATVNTLVRRLARLEADALFLADLPPRFAEPGADVPADSPMAKTFLSFSASARGYDKIRWLDADGRERLRVNNRGEARLVPSAQLQDKSGRPFFLASRGLDPGQVHLSALDLNVDDGVVEHPLQPTLRAVAPVYFDGVQHGAVVINVRMQDLLDQFRREVERTGFAVNLVGADGDWILASDPQDDWNRQLGAPGQGLPAVEPRLWKAMQAVDSGIWRNWQFAALRVGFAGNGNGNGSGRNGMSRAAQEAALGIRVLVHENDTAAHAAGLRWKLLLLALTLFSMWLTVTLIFRVARSMADESRHLRDLEQANDALTLTNARLQKVQDDLVRAQRLSSLGLMVAGVAHELNTPLGSALLALSTVRESAADLGRKLESGLRRSELEGFVAQARDGLALAATELQRSSALVQRFKQVAVDRASLQRRRFDLAEVIVDSDPRLRRRDLGGRVSLALDLAPGIAMDSYPGPLEQAVSNLINNAMVHAFPQDAAGALRVSASVDPSGDALIRIEDDGGGIPEQDLLRIFEPFYTTRRHAGGAGLGLHIVHQIVVEVLGGAIEVRSSVRDPQAPGKPHGTIFTLRIPRRGPEQQPAA